MALRVLIASSVNWTGIARLPVTLSRAGLTVDLLDRGRTQARYSSRFSSRITAKGGIDGVVRRLLAEAGSYDRVIVCNEDLVAALAASDDERAAPLLSAHPSAVVPLVDKTKFTAAAEAVGIRVPRSAVAEDAHGLEAALADIGVPAFLKGAHGAGGTTVRRVDDSSQARSAAADLGYPLLVEAPVAGDLRLAPCLYERGALVAAFVATKVRTTSRFGPSSVNALRSVDDGLRRTAEAAGRAFGLHGFVSIDHFDPGDGSDPVVIEINPRPVAQLHLGAHVGVDMAVALRDVVSGAFDGTPRLGRDGRSVVLFPQELQRLRAERGHTLGTMRWLVTPGAFEDIPWDDLRLVRRHLRRQG